MVEKPSSYPLRLPTSLKQEAAELARMDGTTLNQFIALALAEKVGRTRALTGGDGSTEVKKETSPDTAETNGDDNERTGKETSESGGAASGG